MLADDADGDAASPLIAEDDDALTFTSGALTARIAKGPRWGLDFLADGRRLTGSGVQGDGRDRHRRPAATIVREQLDLGVGRATSTASASGSARW